MKFIKHITYNGLVPPACAREKDTFRQKTVVLEMNNTDFLQLMAKDMVSSVVPIQLIVKLGLSVVHPSDEFSKKKGVAIAEQRMKSETFTVTKCLISNSEETRQLKFWAKSDIVCGKVKYPVAIHMTYDIITGKFRAETFA